MVIASPRSQRERAARAHRSRLQPKALLAIQASWIAAYLIGGGVALAEGDHPAALIGLTVGGIFALLSILAARRRRRVWRRS